MSLRPTGVICSSLFLLLKAIPSTGKTHDVNYEKKEVMLIYDIPSVTMDIEINILK